MDKTQEFIQKAIKIHGDKYDYSKVIYTKAINKIIIIYKSWADFKIEFKYYIYNINLK